jgi:hypothetical protein
MRQGGDFSRLRAVGRPPKLEKAGWTGREERYPSCLINYLSKGTRLRTLYPPRLYLKVDQMPARPISPYPPPGFAEPRAPDCACLTETIVRGAMDERALARSSGEAHRFVGARLKGGSRIEMEADEDNLAFFLYSF